MKDQWLRNEGREGVAPVRSRYIGAEALYPESLVGGYLLNANFRQTTGGDGIPPDGWTVTSGTTWSLSGSVGTAYLVKDSANNLMGSRAVALVNDSSTLAGVQTSGYIPVIETYLYRVRYAVYNTATSANSVFVAWYDRNKQIVSTSATAYVGAGAGWGITGSGELTAPANARFAIVGLNSRASSGGTVTTYLNFMTFTGGYDSYMLNHNEMINLTAGDVHTHYALLAGRSGGQTQVGGTGAGDDYTIRATASGTDGDVIFQSDPTTERMRIASNGDVGVGNASPAFRLDVVTDAASSYVAKFFNDGNNINRQGIMVQCGKDAGTGGGETTYYFVARDGDGGDVGYLNEVAGVFGLVDVSDPSLKTNIAPTNVVALDVLRGLGCIQFEWRKNPGHVVPIGFDAGQMRSVYPHASSEVPGRPLGVAVTHLIPVLVKAIQEISADHQTLMTAHAALMARTAVLESHIQLPISGPPIGGPP